MPVGKNINLEDKIIKKTTGKTSNKRNVSNTRKIGMPSLDPGKETFKTKKMTFYIKKDLLQKLYNFSYWDRRSLTEAFNMVVNDGLKGKNIKQKT
ncbi:hypothetical protein ES705_40630 [subsurface metagenome]|jgi:hypothetical protein|nr:MAG: hypothetical protein ES695_11440 [Candidatus Atribacteria bacterium 1244-E10-H5-B2]RXG66917.1 MAG: hypothetical protein ES695_00850 [Candidatus Atribacteria bacterium 1244-E10-H5-B2]